MIRAFQYFFRKPTQATPDKPMSGSQFEIAMVQLASLGQTAQPQDYFEAAKSALKDFPDKPEVWQHYVDAAFKTQHATTVHITIRGLVNEALRKTHLDQEWNRLIAGVLPKYLTDYSPAPAVNSEAVVVLGTRMLLAQFTGVGIQILREARYTRTRKAQTAKAFTVAATHCLTKGLNEEAKQFADDARKMLSKKIRAA